MPPFPVSILRLRNFRLLVAIRMMTVMALQAQAVIVGWQVYSLTRDPFMLGLVGLTEAIPAIGAALFAGHIVDISHPQRVYAASLVILTFNTLGLFCLAGGVVPLTPGMLVPVIFFGVFISGLARSFTPPATFALLPQIVPRKDMPSASSWLTSGFQAAAITGPAIAGIVYGSCGPRVAWLLPLGLAVTAFILICLMKDVPPPHRTGPRVSAFKSIQEGLVFIFKNQVLLSVMALDMFAVLFGGAVAMLPAYADQILHVGSEGLGALRAAPALGAVIMALFLALRPLKILSARRLMLAVAGFGLCMIGFGLSTSFWLSMGFLAASGAFDSVSMIIRGTLMQLLTPDRMRGRVSAVNSMFIISSNEIGAFESGLAARWLGLAPSVVFGGMATLTIVGLTALLSPKFRQTVIKANESP